jgi:hypothetical protein
MAITGCEDLTVDGAYSSERTREVKGLGDRLLRNDATVRKEEQPVVTQRPLVCEPEDGSLFCAGRAVV